MGFRVEYEVRKLPDTYVTMEKEYSFVDDEKAQPDRWGRKRQVMVVKDVESRGGWLFIVRGKPGHSIRLTSLEQIKAMKLAPKPRMIDNETGEEVNEQGIPLSVEEQLQVGRAMGNVTGAFGTDIDVNASGGGEEEFGNPELGDEAHVGPVPVEVNTAIDKLE